jgi:hypothetical protein
VPPANLSAVVRKLGALLVGCIALLFGGASAGADPVPTTPPADLHACTLPGSMPYWFDYADGAVPFWQLFASPKVIAAVPNLGLPAQIRAKGGQTVYFDLYLRSRAGLPSQPQDPSTMNAKADRLFLYVENSTHCSNPIIAENELYGAGLATPWSPTNAQYRANVLTFLRRLHDLGAQPWLLVNSTPYTAGDAGDWWRAVAQVAGIVREVYFPAPMIYKQGAVLGSRTLRTAFRKALLDFTQIGIPASKLGIFLGFQTTRGQGGREGLEPARAWFETVKLQALAAKQVARELHFHGIWSWGWAEYKTAPGEQDPDKAGAACVYLWARNPSLCAGPNAAGKGFDTSRTEGQLNLPGTVRCRITGVGSLGWSAIKPIAGLTGDPELAFSDAYARVLEQRLAGVNTKDVLAAERSVIGANFKGSRSAYVRALAQAKTSLAVARTVIADELRRARISSRFRVATPSNAAVAEFQQTYAELQARLVQTRARASWLGGRKVGYAVQSNAPGEVMNAPSRRWTSVWSTSGPVRVRPLGPPLPLGSVPLGQARASIRAALMSQEREARYPTWIGAQQSRSFDRAICWRDELPAVGIADLTDYLPFVTLPS